MFDDLRYRLRALFRPSSVERELDDELRFHIEQHAAMEERAGVAPDEALRRARLAFGGVDRMKEASRDGRGIQLLDVLLRDLRYAVRLLARSPIFTSVAVLSLALGMGANTAMFQLLNALVLRELPIRAPQELVEVRLPDSDLDAARGNMYHYPAMTNPQFEALRARQSAFSGLFAWSDEDVNLAPAGEVRRAPGLWVSGNFFDVLGLTPAAGRLFTAADDRPGCGLPGVVVSHDFWQRQLGGQRDAIGRTLTINARQVEVIGVAPAGFTGLQVGQAFDVAQPICAMDTYRPGARMLESGTSWWLIVMGRLRPDTTIAQADAHVRTLAPAIFEATLPSDYPANSVPAYKRASFFVQSAATGRSFLREEYATALRLLLAMTGIVLLIACTNLTNLMLARGAARHRELSLRLALGASRGRLLLQLLCESVVIVGLGVAAGALVAGGLSGALVGLIGTAQQPITLALSPDWRVALFVAGTAIATCLILGLAPALRATRRAPGDAMKAGGRVSTADGVALRRGLVVAQVAVSLVLVVGALLFARSVQNLLAEPRGFDAEGVLVVDAGLPPPAPAPEAAAALKRDLAVRLRAVPGVVAVGETNVVPLSGNTTSNTVWPDGGKREQGTNAFFSRVGPGYFDTLRMPILDGRAIGPQDAEGAPLAAVVNETFARAVAPGGSPIGHRFWVEATPTRPERLYEIVGLVADAKYRTLREPAAPVVFLALAQHGAAGAGGTFLVRAATPGMPIAAGVRAALRQVDPRLRYVVRPLDGQIGEALLRDRALAILSAILGLVAAGLAAVGLHGVVAYAVERRRRDIGIRLALGASRASIAKGVLRESAWLVAGGLAAGLGLSAIATGTARSLLFNLEPGDVATTAAAVAALAAVALTASLLPARRAARVDPMTTLKDD
jgi:predicted permease